jgi:hypothetical protein
VQWKGTDRYADIDAMVSTPAWVRRKASLTATNKGRPTGKASLKEEIEVENEEQPKQPDSGSLFDYVNSSL